MITSEKISILFQLSLCLCQSNILAPEGSKESGPTLKAAALYPALRTRRSWILFWSVVMTPHIHCDCSLFSHRNNTLTLCFSFFSQIIKQKLLNEGSSIMNCSGQPMTSFVLFSWLHFYIFFTRLWNPMIILKEETNSKTEVTFF